MKARLAAVAGLACLAGGALADCAPPPDPVLTLDYGSRYTDESETRSDLDPEADAAVRAAQEATDGFLVELSNTVEAVHGDPDGAAAAADCVVARMAAWARGDALADMASQTARLTVGSRFASFAMIALQAAPHTGRAGDLADVRAWLSRRMYEQMTFWEAGATTGATRGNLRAWAALAASATALQTGDPVMRGWAAWSVRYILCTAAEDGSLPQEMSRANYALHYQLHAVAPLVVSVVLLRRQGIDLGEVCDGALHRAARFALEDIESGEATKAITGVTQTFFDGTDEIENFTLAWIEAYLTLRDDPAFELVAQRWRPLSHSKLGGNQTVLWGRAQGAD